MAPSDTTEYTHTHTPSDTTTHTLCFLSFFLSFLAYFACFDGRLALPAMHAGYGAYAEGRRGR
eukprot:COSAG06_NODE_59559_length_273_cov_2620.218391_1_plen_62_part_10